MWKKLLVISLLIMIICPGISQAYYSSLYDNQTIVRGEVVGDLKIIGRNQIKVKYVDGPHRSNWIAHINGIDGFSFEENKAPYNKTYYNCTNLTLAPLEGKSGFFRTFNKIFNGTVSFDQMQSSHWVGQPATGYKIDGILLKGVSGELNGTMEDDDGMNMGNVIISFGGQTVISTDIGYDIIRFNSSGKINVTVTLLSNYSMFLNFYNIIWSPLNGKLMLRTFQGTVVQNGKIFYGDVTLVGKNISIRTIQEPYWGSTAWHSNDDPSQYWKIEVTFTEGVISGNYYTYWSIGAIIGVVAIVPINITGCVYWAIKRKQRTNR